MIKKCRKVNVAVGNMNYVKINYFNAIIVIYGYMKNAILNNN